MTAAVAQGDPTSPMSPPTTPPAPPTSRRAAKRVLPGFNITLGFTLFYLSVIVLIPLSALIFKTFNLTWDQFVTAVTSPRVMASYRLTFGASFIAATSCTRRILAPFRAARSAAAKEILKLL